MLIDKGIVMPETDNQTAVSGQLPISVYTFQLEAIAKRFLNQEPFQFKTVRERIYLEFPSSEAVYDFTAILKYANFQSIKFSQEDCDKYLRGPNFGCRYERNYIQPNPQESELLHYGEMCAINIYTNEEYVKSINALLRGTFDFTERPDAARERFLHAVFCSSGLNKLTAPENVPLVVHRNEEFPDQDKNPKAYSRYVRVLRERINASMVSGVIQFEGFTSTSVDKDIINRKFSPHVEYEITLPSSYAKNIANFTSHRGEGAEYLIPPSTHMKINEYKQTEYQRIFKMEPVNDPIQPEYRVAKDLLHDLSQHIDRSIKRLDSGLLNQIGVFYSKTTTAKKKQDYAASLQLIYNLNECIEGGTVNPSTLFAEVDHILQDVDRINTISRKQNSLFFKPATPLKMDLSAQTNSMSKPVKETRSAQAFSDFKNKYQQMKNDMTSLTNPAKLTTIPSDDLNSSPTNPQKI